MTEQLNARHPLSKATRILDLGCGPGSVTSQIIKDHGSSLNSSVTITASDISPEMISQVEAQRSKQLQDDPESLWKRVTTVASDAQDLAVLKDDQYSHIAAGLVLFLLPEPQKALAECHKHLTPGGTLTASCWPHSEWQDLMKLLGKVCPDKPPYSVPEAWSTIESVRGELEEASFTDIYADQKEIAVEYQDPRQVCDWFMTNIPYFVRNTADLGAEKKQEVHDAMLHELTEKNGQGSGRMVGACIVATGKKGNTRTTEVE